MEKNKYRVETGYQHFSKLLTRSQRNIFKNSQKPLEIPKKNGRGKTQRASQIMWFTYMPVVCLVCDGIKYLGA